jgi:isopentenyl-diphosphate Delta-isomerase
MEDLIVLVDPQNNPIGTLPKSQVHHANTPLHRAFSVFLFNKRGELLLQQRSRFKQTWPLVRSNSCCGHPGPNEPTLIAADRRLKHELNITDATLYELISDYHYRAEKDGIVEHEICPIIVGFSQQIPQLNPFEVETIKYLPWSEWVSEVKINPDKYSPWCIEETLLLEQQPQLYQLMQFHS